MMSIDKIYSDRAKKYLSAKLETKYLPSEFRFFSKGKFTKRKKGRAESEYLYKKMVGMHNSYFSMVTMAGSDGSILIGYSAEYSSPHGTIFHYMSEGLENIFFSIHAVDRYEERCNKTYSCAEAMARAEECDIMFQSNTSLDRLCLALMEHGTLNEMSFNRIGKTEMYVKVSDIGVLSVHKLGEVYLVKTFMTIDMVKCGNWRECKAKKLYLWLDKAFNLTDEVLNV